MSQHTHATGDTTTATYGPIGDENTGLNFPAADQAGLLCGGVQTLLATATGVTITGTLSLSSTVDFTVDDIVCDSITGADGTFNLTGLAGTTGVGGTVAIAGGVAFATGNNNGGPVTITGGAGENNGTGGAVTLTGGASDGAGGTGGSINLASGAPAGGTDGSINIQTVTTGKVGFFGATAVVRQSAYTQTYSTADKTHANPTATALTNANGTADGTLDDVTGSHSQTILNNNFKECTTGINALILDLADLKQLVNSVIDDLQAYGLLQ